MCGDERPQDYQVPDLYLPDQEEIERLHMEELSMLQYEEVNAAKLNMFLYMSNLISDTLHTVTAHLHIYNSFFV